MGLDDGHVEAGVVPGVSGPRLVQRPAEVVHLLVEVGVELEVLGVLGAPAVPAHPEVQGVAELLHDDGVSDAPSDFPAVVDRQLLALEVAHEHELGAEELPPGEDGE